MKFFVILIIVAVSIIRSVISAANEKAQKEKRLQGRMADPDRKRRVQSEIESFLSEVSGAQPQQRPGRPQKSEAQKQREKRRQQQAEAQRRQEQERRRQQKILAQKKAAREKKEKHRVGSGIGEHVDQYISQHVAEHIDNDIEEYVEDTIVDSVNQHLGTRKAEMPATTQNPVRKSDAAASIAAMLRNPEGVRNAIIINEVLSRPRRRG